MLYGPHRPGVVPTGPVSNRVMSGSPDGLPARLKHGTTCTLGWPGPVSCRSRPYLCWAKSYGPRDSGFNVGQNFWTTSQHGLTYCFLLTWHEYIMLVPHVRFAQKKFDYQNIILCHLGGPHDTLTSGCVGQPPLFHKVTRQLH
jgi:hypothetical protein